jgi:hypothetical protein
VFKDPEIVARIWDSFLLEGEIFAYKTALAILKYFELELKILTFDGAITFLKKMEKEIPEDILFNLIDGVNMYWRDFQTVIEGQKVADVNTNIHLALLI